MDGFSKFHPVICFFYFAATIVFAMVFMHPALSLISLIGACSYFVKLNSFTALLNRLKFMLPLFIIAIIFNALFNRQGDTILFSAAGLNITLESLFYGLVAALNLGLIITWFSCFNNCFDSNKIMYLFSGVSPATALLFTSSMKLSGSLNQKYNEIVRSKALIYGASYDKSLKSKLTDLYENILILASWSFENSIFTALSMRSRGIELKGKTYYSNYRFLTKDFITLIIILSLTSIITSLAVGGTAYCEFYPQISIQTPTPYTYVLYFAYAVFCFFPILIGSLEVIRWLRLSKLKT